MGPFTTKPYTALRWIRRFENIFSGTKQTRILLEEEFINHLPFLDYSLLQNFKQL